MGKRKKRNRGKKMKIVKPLGVNQTIERITDVKDANIFGIHLTTQNALDSFQEKSGMKGPYSVEYQHHYWAAVGRMEMAGQILDVAIPMVMFNYPQRVSGSSVKFDMAQVEDMSIQLTELAVAKTKEFMTVCGAEMTEKFGFKWNYVPTHTLHVHPGRLSSFSGTDYDKNPNDPGIVYPLSEATNQASFSSIMCHSGSRAELIRTEYRLFTGTHTGKKSYRHGKCISYVKRDRKENGPIEAMFVGNKATEESYVFKDGFIQDQGDDLVKMLADIFDKSGFEPSTDFILEKNITKSSGFPGYANRNTAVMPGKKGTQTKMFENNKAFEHVAEYTNQEMGLMRQFIQEHTAFSWKEVFNMEDEDILFFYKEAVSELETEKRKDIPVEIVKEEIVVTDDGIQTVLDFEEDETVLDIHEIEIDMEIDTIAEEEEITKQYQFLLMQGFEEDEIMQMTNEGIADALRNLGYNKKRSELNNQADKEAEIYAFLKENGITDAEILKMDEQRLRDVLTTLSYEED